MADQICQRVAELPDRDSPADWPEAMLVTPDELRNIILDAINDAAQAVAAQAAPAAVAVPEITDAMVDAYLAEQRRSVEEADRFGRSNIGGLHTNTVRDACRNGLRAALAATPALPATEDSSAGDQAAVVHASTYVQPVPDHCDRIVWRGQYIHLPIAQAEVQAEPVADCYSDDDGDTWRDLPSDIDFVQGRKLGEEFELQASIRSWPEVFRVTKVPDENDDDYEVEPVSIRTAPQAQPAGALDWAVQRWNDEVRNRPLVNIHRRSLDNTWRQVITYLGGDAEKLIGPSHDDLLAAAQEGGHAAKEA
ncbi:hypothetical protein DCO45_02905 [Comamonas sp. JNW]|nr:hypothetical protein DCO45_02905 [Comamonas sp. JNW]